MNFKSIHLVSTFLFSMCLTSCGGGSGDSADGGSTSNSTTAPGIEVETQSAYSQGNQSLSSVVIQVQQNYQNQMQNGQIP